MTKHDYIEATVCAFYGIETELIKHGFRFEEYLLPRQLTIYLLNEFTDRIDKGAVMGRYGLNRATFYNCIRAIDGRRKNKSFEIEYQKLHNIIEIGLKYSDEYAIAKYESAVISIDEECVNSLHRANPRTGDYRIALRKSIDILYDKISDIKEQLKPNENSEAATAPDATD